MRLWVIAAIVAAGLSTVAQAQQAQEIEGTWKLVMRKLQDGTTQVPPAVAGAATFQHGLTNVVVYWRTPEGKPVSFSIIANYKLSRTEWTETLLGSVFDDGSGKPPVYSGPVFNTTESTKTVQITREGSRIAFKPPFEGVSYTFEGDKWIATNERLGRVDYWDRVR